MGFLPTRTYHVGGWYPPYHCPHSNWNKCSLYRGEDAHIYVGIQDHEYEVTVFDEGDLYTGTFCDDTNTVLGLEYVPRPHTLADDHKLQRLQTASEGLVAFLASA